ncbi:amidohydrolase family protein [Streptomyces sp. NPDC052052]|uniref:amidohydrolase family protein n=1 Tax=Streptomyces sp. NPDC052052 TaxID=3154756 RepID=UPI00341D5B8C
MTEVRDATRLLLRDAELGTGRRADVRVLAGRIAEVAPSLARRPGEEAVDCRGGLLLPGLADHHLHLHALAAYRGSVPCGPPAVRERTGLADALATADPDEGGWIRGVGYHETVAGDLDAAALDLLHPQRPVRVQHRSGALWMLNSAAMRSVRLDSGDHPGIERDTDGSPTGRLWRADDWLRDRLPSARPPDLTAVGRDLARYGVTAVTDATPALAPDALAALTDDLAHGRLPQHVLLLGAPLPGEPPGPLPAPRAAAPPLALPPRGRSGLRPTAGPYKMVLADSGLPSLDDLVERVRAVHTAGRAVAVHAVSREALVLLLVALREAGTAPGDRIEHASVVPGELVGEIGALGLRVVTQPGFLADRGDDYAAEVPAGEHADLYRCRSFLAGGVRLALSSDAPYGPLDPWTVVAAAVRRTTPLGRVLSPSEVLTPAAALDAYLSPPGDPGGPPRRVAAGAVADLVLFHTPRAAVLADPDAGAVRTTFLGREWPTVG